jgi:hypothetical protein
MKKIFLMILVSLALTISVKANLLYYTFEGTVDYSAEEEVEAKDKTKIVFAVDVNKPGYDSYIGSSRPDVYYEDGLYELYSSLYNVDFFYSDIVSGFMAQTSISNPEVDYHVGASYVSTPDNGIYFISGGNDKDCFYVMSSTSAVNTWKVKDLFDGYEQIFLSNANTILIHSNLTLTRISNSFLEPESPVSRYTPFEPPPPISNVPEPLISSTLFLGLLFVSGIYGLWRKKTDTDKSNFESRS